MSSIKTQTDNNTAKINVEVFTETSILARMDYTEVKKEDEEAIEQAILMITKTPILAENKRVIEVAKSGFLTKTEPGNKTRIFQPKEWVHRMLKHLEHESDAQPMIDGAVTHSAMTMQTQTAFVVDSSVDAFQDGK